MVNPPMLLKQYFWLLYHLKKTGEREFFAGEARKKLPFPRIIEKLLAFEF
jgi:hypothetical protein